MQIKHCLKNNVLNLTTKRTNVVLFTLGHLCRLYIFRSLQGYSDEKSSTNSSLFGDRKRKAPAGFATPKQTPNQRERRHPPHLRGSAIGLWYRDNPNTKNFGDVAEKLKKQDIDNRAVISLKNEDYLTSLIKQVGVKNNKYDHRNVNDGVVNTNISEDVEMELLLDPFLDKQLYEESQNQNKSKAYEEMLRFRQQLPSYAMRDVILATVRENQVSLISGETGCGKTTQVKTT